MIGKWLRGLRDQYRENCELAEGSARAAKEQNEWELRKHIVINSYQTDDFVMLPRSGPGGGQYKEPLVITRVTTESGAAFIVYVISKNNAAIYRCDTGERINYVEFYKNSPVIATGRFTRHFNENVYQLYPMLSAEEHHLETIGYEDKTHVSSTVRELFDTKDIVVRATYFGKEIIVPIRSRWSENVQCILDGKETTISSIQLDFFLDLTNVELIDGNGAAVGSTYPIMVEPVTDRESAVCAIHTEQSAFGAYDSVYFDVTVKSEQIYAGKNINLDTLYERVSRTLHVMHGIKLQPGVFYPDRIKFQRLDGTFHPSTVEGFASIGATAHRRQITMEDWRDMRVDSAYSPEYSNIHPCDRMCWESEFPKKLTP